MTFDLVTETTKPEEEPTDTPSGVRRGGEEGDNAEACPQERGDTGRSREETQQDRGRPDTDGHTE